MVPEVCHRLAVLPAARALLDSKSNTINIYDTTRTHANAHNLQFLRHKGYQNGKPEQNPMYGGVRERFIAAYVSALTQCTPPLSAYGHG